MSDAPNGIHLNGHLNGNASLNGDNIVVDANSPDTPINTTAVLESKIDVDYVTGESDLRHEPAPVKLDKVQELRDASIVPQLATPVDPESLPIAPPNGSPPPPPGELLEDVKMAEQGKPTVSDDVTMTDADIHPTSANGPPNGVSHQSPAANITVDSLHTSSPYSVNNSPNDDDDKPPPAKRARKYSDPEKASLANSATPPPASVSPVPEAPAYTGPTTLSASQWRFCASTVRTLKKLKDCSPFLHPVDHVALNIPHYPSIIKQPMDFSTIERKLSSSNPSKPDPSPANPRYFTADQFIADIRLIFNNCNVFNGPDHPITHMGKRVEAVFDKQIKQIPPPEEVKVPVVKKQPTPQPVPVAPPKKPVRKASTSVPVIRRSEETIGRPKREIHPPPPKDLPYADLPKKRKSKNPKDGNVQQLKFCEKVCKDLHKKIHYNIAHPFYEPVDWVKLEIPAYPRMIKKPMDLSTIKKKLEGGEYATAEKFHDDFKLMIRNCFQFNPTDTPVNNAGHELDRLFDEKWKNLPSLVPLEDSEEEEEEEDEGSEEHDRIADLESQIESMNRALEDLKKNKVKEKKEKKKEKREKPAPVASTSKPTAKQTKAAPPPGRKNKKKPISDDDVLSFEQKKDLSDTISKLDGAKLERVIQIIHEGVPEIRDSTEEIELEIDQLPAAVLTKLYNFVIRPMKPPPAKRARTGKGTGTGGLKRKSMDEDVEAEKIRVLEERMALFSNPGKANASAASHRAAAAAHHNDSEHSSDSSSGSDSSGSDSE